MDLQFATPGGDFQSLASKVQSRGDDALSSDFGFWTWESFLVRDNIFDRHRRRLVVGLDAGIHGHHAADGGEPKLPILALPAGRLGDSVALNRSEEHTSELQSRLHLV